MSADVMSDPRVWVRTGSMMQPYRLVDARPMTADTLGHVFVFDGGGSDPDNPYTCLLCCRPKWAVYKDRCADADRLGELNAERAAWIDAHRAEGISDYYRRLGYVASSGVAA